MSARFPHSANKSSEIICFQLAETNPFESAIDTESFGVQTVRT
jgi:hypothetical protein